MNSRNASFNDSETPMVTILVNHRGTSETLNTCLDSIVKQSYPNIEIVLYDFGTTDSSWDCAVLFQIKYPGIFTLLRVRTDMIFKPYFAHYPNIRGRYFMVIDSAIVLSQNTISNAVSKIHLKTSCAFVLMGSNKQIERERFLGNNCEIPGIEFIQLHLLSVPYPGSSIALYDSDIGKTPGRHNPYIKQADMAFNNSVISISEPQFTYTEKDDFEDLYFHFLSLCRNKIDLIRKLSNWNDSINIAMLEIRCFKRFAVELMLLSKQASEQYSFENALRLFFMGVAQFPDFIREDWYQEVHEALTHNRISTFWQNGFASLYSSNQFHLPLKDVAILDGK